MLHPSRRPGRGAGDEIVTTASSAGHTVCLSSKAETGCDMRNVIVFIFLIWLSAHLAMAQATAGMGSISGAVTDGSGALLGDAKVTVSNPQKGIRRTTLTTQSGLFSTPALAPSAGYKVTVEKQGFATYTADDLTVQVGENLDLHVQLQVAGVKQTVEVTGALVLDDTKTEVSQVVSDEQIQDLPINGGAAIRSCC